MNVEQTEKAEKWKHVIDPAPLTPEMAERIAQLAIFVKEIGLAGCPRRTLRGANALIPELVSLTQKLREARLPFNGDMRAHFIARQVFLEKSGYKQTDLLAYIQVKEAFDNSAVCNWIWYGDEVLSIAWNAAATELALCLPETPITTNPDRVLLEFARLGLVRVGFHPLDHDDDKCFVHIPLKSRGGFQYLACWREGDEFIKYVHRWEEGLWEVDCFDFEVEGLPRHHLLSEFFPSYKKDRRFR